MGCRSTNEGAQLMIQNSVVEAIGHYAPRVDLRSRGEQIPIPTSLSPDTMSKKQARILAVMDAEREVTPDTMTRIIASEFGKVYDEDHGNMHDFMAHYDELVRMGYIKSHKLTTGGIDLRSWAKRDRPCLFERSSSPNFPRTH